MTLRMLPAPFVGWLLVLMFLLVMQFLIKYLPQLVGKGLPVQVVVELIAYNLAYMMVLAVPMAALITTLMTFGRLAESNAWAVMKGSGVSFGQMVWPVYIVGILLTAGMWYFNTEIHPESNFRARNLWQDIRTAKPGFDLQAGVLYDELDEYRILVREIPPDRPNELRNITIYDYTDGSRYRTDITAEEGLLETSNNGRVLRLTLFRGEVHRRRPMSNDSVDRYERLAFDRHLMRISLDDLDFRRTDPTEGTRTDRTMRTRDMVTLVDSLKMEVAAKVLGIEQLMARLGSGEPSREQWKSAQLAPGIQTQGFDTHELARNSARGMRAGIESGRRTITWAGEKASRYEVEIHKKYSIALACLLFMALAAPLGLSIRRGGLGTSAMVAMFIFMFHWISLANGEKFADRGYMDPWLGMWLADIVTGILALLVTVYVWFDLGAAQSPLRRLIYRLRRSPDPSASSAPPPQAPSL